MFTTLERKSLETIDSLLWEKTSENRCRCIGLKEPDDILKELETRLIAMNTITSGFFRHSAGREAINCSDIDEINYECFVCFGNCEGIRLDINACIHVKEIGWKTIPFFTGKIYTGDAPSYRKLGELATECSLLLNGGGNFVLDGYKTNKVYATPFSEKPMTVKELLYALGFDSKKYIGRINDSDMLERISGHHCDCPENEGEFILLPLNSEEVMDGMKRYMKCRKCGCYSHL